jgi:hypothetical protein
MTKDETLDLALEAFVRAERDGYWSRDTAIAVEAIKQALAAPVQEPVAWVPIITWRWNNEQGYWEGRTIAPPAAPVQEPVAWIADTKRGYNTVGYECKKVNALPHGTMLYTTPPAARRQWVGLTDEERNKLWRDVVKWGDPSHDDVDLIKAIEAKLKERNQ